MREEANKKPNYFWLMTRNQNYECTASSPEDIKKLRQAIIQ